MHEMRVPGTGGQPGQPVLIDSAADGAWYVAIGNPDSQCAVSECWCKRDQEDPAWPAWRWAPDRPLHKRDEWLGA